MTSQIKLLIADDHAIFRHGLRQILEKDPDLKIVGEAADGEAALRLLPNCGADVAILDIDMPIKDGFDVVREIREQRWLIQVVFLTMYKDERFLNTALDLGVKGYVLKDGAFSEIVQCIKFVVSGQDYVSPQLGGFLSHRRHRAAQ